MEKKISGAVMPVKPAAAPLFASEQRGGSGHELYPEPSQHICAWLPNRRGSGGQTEGVPGGEPGIRVDFSIKKTHILIIT